jgi:phosphopantothenoylcysteine synthetase/decarboxylase
VRVEPRKPQEPDPLPPADAVIAAPLTFNSLNKWATGISDTLALGLLNEALGLDIPITTVPCVKEALQRHPAYLGNTQLLTSAGVAVLDQAKALTRSEAGITEVNWSYVERERIRRLS